MSHPELSLIGCGGHAISCIDVIEQQDIFKIVGLVGLPEEKLIKSFEYPVIATDNELVELAKSYSHALITVGQIKTPEIRIRLYQHVMELGFKLPTIVSPRAYISPHTSIGLGTIIMHGAVINARVKIGNNSIINSCALVEHGVAIGDHAHISTGAILNGDVCVGPGSYIGSGSTIKEGVTIGRNCIVGMGLAVRRNLADNTHFLGQEKHDT